jgi:flavin reductase (DIM6/NTAB) family NADH-FMN oxidoreductase RutF
VTAVEFGEELRPLAPAVANSEEMRLIFSRFPAAVGALCAMIDGVRIGMVATTLTVGVSYDPPMVLFSVRNASATWEQLRAAPCLGISVLGEDQGAAVRQLAGPAEHRFDDLATTYSNHRALFVNEAVTWMECIVDAEVPAGDHTVVTCRVVAIGHSRAARPLVFHDGRFPRLLGDDA